MSTPSLEDLLNLVTCKGCGEDLPRSEYYRSTQTKSGIQGKCKKCHCAQSNAAKARNPKRHQYGRTSQLRWKYGIDIADYERMLEAQGGVCAICSEACSSGRRLAVDHCHETGEVRGLLCAHCNQGLGKFRDDVQRLGKAITYLKDAA